MNDFMALPRDEAQRLQTEVAAHYARLRDRHLAINMARGVPSSEQLDLSTAMLDCDGYFADDGTDCRNYMGQQGLPEARALFAPLLGVPAEQVVVDGNSSLALMHDCIAYAWRSGTCDSARPWSAEPEVAFLCPVPGYDRHFALCEAFGIRLIPITLHDDGPDLDEVAQWVKDPAVRGMWCVPKYSNPTGAIYSDEVIDFLALMETAAADFRLFWDDAYSVHHLTAEPVRIANVSERCQRHGHANRALVFASTSKMTFAGAGLALFGSSPANIAWWLRHAAIRSVGPDKLNQLRHVRFLRDLQGLEALMDGHREILAPRFEAVRQVFERLLAPWRVARWSVPRGGYFISVDCLPGTARRVVELAKAAGVQMTAAGAAFPQGLDPRDSHLRIAPSSPAPDDLEQAAEVIATSILLAACEIRL
ncbi:aminotransferase class I/II-fold pyridoxal phosphate-dependent enzyme [Pseudomonas japonica]|uniref:aminotransferase class I/II-fold pyridoxal phosphate-dependent enzyme n=1 Tax=Pseudomonas japonica TaxID=256466 RepID=UPI003802C640